LSQSQREAKGEGDWRKRKLDTYHTQKRGRERGNFRGRKGRDRDDIPLRHGDCLKTPSFRGSEGLETEFEKRNPLSIHREKKGIRKRQERRRIRLR